MMFRVPQKTQFILFFLSFLCLLLAGACAPTEPSSRPTATSAHRLDTPFAELYDRLGGGGILGPVISPPRFEGVRKIQYTENALLIYDPQAPAAERFGLAPLGLEMGLAEPPLPTPEVANSRYIDGHYIGIEFYDHFLELGGLQAVGRPLTEVHYDPVEQKSTQYFENLGFYRFDSDPPGEVRHLAYGAWKCDLDCRSNPDEQAMILLPRPVPEPYAGLVSAIGSDLTGFALSDPYMTSDNRVEQVFENLVLYVDTSLPQQAQIRAIHQDLGILPDPLVGASPDPEMFFFTRDGDLGYNIPRDIWEYIAAHGGFETSGPPITELQPFRGQAYQQCFTNLCLQREPSGAIRPVSLGYTYRQLRAGGEPTALPTLTPSATPEPSPTPEIAAPITPVPSPTHSRVVTIQVWVEHQTLEPEQEQEFGAAILENNAPLEGVQPVLVLTLPDGAAQPYVMPPTASDGQTRLRIPPITAGNGTLIPYEVCISASSGSKYCFRDNFLIWKTP